MYSVSQAAGQMFSQSATKRASHKSVAQSVSQHLLAPAISKNFLSRSSPPGHTHSGSSQTLAERQIHRGTIQPNGYSCHSLLHFVLKQAAVLPLKSRIYSTDVSLSGAAVSLALVYSVM